MPEGYVPPVGHEALLSRYGNGERYFERASLNHAILSNQLLSNVNLSHSQLVDAHFDHAALDNVDLTGAHCASADFSHATLYQCCFAKADLRQVIWYMTGLRHVSFFDAQLDHAQFLECIQWSLREESEGLMASAAIGRSCFVSYASADRFAERVAQALQRADVPHWFMPFASWFGRDSLLSERLLSEHLRRAIGLCDAFVLVLSKGTLESRWVRLEVDTAARLHRSTGKPALIVAKGYRDAAVVGELQPFKIVDCVGDREAAGLGEVTALLRNA
jgi:hypothetical protein